MAFDKRNTEDFDKEDRQDLVARLMGAQALGHFLFKAYDALKNYGVDFKELKEWARAVEVWDEARKLKPHAAQWSILNSITTLENGLKAAIRRTQFRLQNGGLRVIGKDDTEKEREDA